MFDAPPAWFRDEVHTLISRGDIRPEEGLLTMIHPPDWAYGERPVGTALSASVLLRTCSRCGLDKPEEDFYVRPDGQVYIYCRPCEAARRRKAKSLWDEERRERERAKDRARSRRVAA